MAVADVEITICGARDLKNVNWKHGDLCAYAVAWIDDDGKPPTKVTTRVDASGDTNPSWEQTFTLSVNKERLEDAHLTIEIYHDNAEVDQKKAIIGCASLALLEVADAGGYNEALDYSLKLKRPSGRPHGKLNIAARLREKRGAYTHGPPPPSAYGQSYYNEGGQANRDWQPAYAGYTSPYPPQPYAQNYPSQPAYPYGGGPSYGAGAAPPEPYGPYGGNPTYGASAPDRYYNEPQINPAGDQKTSKFGGIGTGIAVGVVAGAVGGLALGEYIDHKEDEAAEEQAEEDGERYEAARDDGYGGGEDYGYGDGDDC